MDEPNAERTSTPGRSWPGANVYKSLKLGWHWRRLRWAVGEHSAEMHSRKRARKGSPWFGAVVRETGE